MMSRQLLVSFPPIGFRVQILSLPLSLPRPFSRMVRRSDPDTRVRETMISNLVQLQSWEDARVLMALGYRMMTAQLYHDMWQKKFAHPRSMGATIHRIFVTCNVLLFPYIHHYSLVSLKL